MSKEHNYHQAVELLHRFNEDADCINCTEATPLQDAADVGVNNGDLVRLLSVYPDYGPLKYAFAEYFVRHGVEQAKQENIQVASSSFNMIRSALTNLQEKETSTVLIPTPTFGNYTDHIPNSYNIDFFDSNRDDFKIDAYALSEEIRRKKPDVVLLENPVNPTGQVLQSEELKAIADACDEVGSFVMCDEIFSETIESEQEIPSIAKFMNPEKVLAIHGIGKSYGAPGARVCGAFSDDSTIEVISPGNICGDVSGISAEYASKLMSADNKPLRDGYRSKSTKIFRDSVEEISSYISNINKELSMQNGRDKEYLKLIKPESTNVALLDFSNLKNESFLGDNVKSGIGVACTLYNKANLAVVPCEAFMLPPESAVVRIPISPKSRIMEGLESLEKTVAAQKKTSSISPSNFVRFDGPSVGVCSRVF